MDEFGEIVYVPGVNRVVLLGGLRYLGGTNVAAVEGTWLLDPASRSWSRLVADLELPPRFGHAAAVAGTDIVVFGGADAMSLQRCSEGEWCFAQVLGDTWALDMIAGVWGTLDASPSPSARYGSAMAFDPVSNRVILFGGGTLVDPGRSVDLLNDTWVLDMNTRQWVELEPAAAPPPRAWHRMLYDPAAGRIILIGGIGSGSESTWSYDPASNTWEQLEDSPLGSRWGIAATLDPESGLIYAIGGQRAWSNGTRAQGPVATSSSSARCGYGRGRLAGEASRSRLRSSGASPTTRQSSSSSCTPEPSSRQPSSPSWIPRRPPRGKRTNPTPAEPRPRGLGLRNLPPRAAAASPDAYSARLNSSIRRSIAGTWPWMASHQPGAPPGRPVRRKSCPAARPT